MSTTQDSSSGRPSSSGDETQAHPTGTPEDRSEGSRSAAERMRDGAMARTAQGRDLAARKARALRGATAGLASGSAAGATAGRSGAGSPGSPSGAPGRTRAVTAGGTPGVDLQAPLLLLDVPLDTGVEFAFVQALMQASRAVLITVPFGDLAALDRLEEAAQSLA